VGIKAKLIAAIPSSVADCKADYRSPAQRKEKADEAKLQSEEHRSTGNTNGSQWRGRKW
jgi:hypothetical protein